MRHALLAALLLSSTVALDARPMAPSPAIAAAVANKDRPADAVALDANRKPAEVLSFMQLKPGMATIDVITGSGYYAELMARAVGPKGSVVAYSPQAFYDRAKAKVDAMLAHEPNARLQTDLRTALTPATYDFAMIHLNYHDFYWESEQFKVPRTDPNAVLALLFKAMKPGGIVAVVDHVGPAGDTRAIVDKLHRIDPAVVKADFERAGFKLEASSPLLADPADDHSKSVFDPSIRGKTDRFTYRFRKPKMNELIAGSDMARTIQLAIAPVFLLAGIGAFLNVIAGRLARVVDRARHLEELHPRAESEAQRRYVGELRTLEQRMTLASRAIYFGTASGLAVCLLVIVLFVGELIDFNLGDFIAVLFVIAISLLAAAMVMFLRETRIALRALHVREDLLTAEAETRH